MAYLQKHDEELADEDEQGHGGEQFGGDEEGEEEQPKLELDVKIDERSACERHITVTISRADIDRYMDKEYQELVPEAHVPGFRPGHAPRKLVEHRFRKEVANKVKGELVMDSLEQIHEDYDLSAISEPDLDLGSIEVPESGPMTFEFDLEVRPQFDMPQWKGLRIEKPVKEFTDADVDRAMTRLLSNRGSLVPVDKPARPGDYITTNLTFKDGDTRAFQRGGGSHSPPPDAQLPRRQDRRLRPGDDRRPGGETRSLTMTVSEDADNESLRGKQVTGVFEVLEVKVLNCRS